MELVWIGVAVVVVFLVASNGVIGAAKKKQTDNPDEALNAWFDGRDQVIVEQAAHTLDADTILAGGNERGYRMVSSEQMPYPRNGTTKMLFEKVSD